MKKLTNLFIALLFTLFANAGTLTYTNTVVAFTDYVQDITVPQFNPSVGTLKGIIVQAQYIERKTVGLENRGTADQTFTVSVTNTIALTSLNAIDNNTYISTNTVVKTLKSFDGVRDYAGLSGYTTNINTTNSVSANVISFAPFVGYSVIPVHATVIGRFYGTYPGGSYASYIDDLVEIRLFVQYTYDPPCICQ